MSAGEPPAVALFEPWSLGDVIIAASVLRELIEPATLACHGDWHPIVREILRDTPELRLLSVDLPYTTRKRGSPFDASGRSKVMRMEEVSLVLSIRGDARDYMAARNMFPRARIRMTGWIRFWARKSALLNSPFLLGFASVQNRYRSWASLAGISYDRVEQAYRERQSGAPRNGEVVIHIGAQWRSKQYPHVVELREVLRRHGYEVRLVAGEKDLLPRGVDEAAVMRAQDQPLIELLRSAEHVITNDSGPMHLAAFLGCRTTALVRTSPIEEWVPPATRIVASDKTPRGYRPHRRYKSDEILSDWPSIAAIVDGLPAPQIFPKSVTLASHLTGA